MRSPSLLFACTLALAVTAGPVAAEESSWDWAVAPYVLGAGLSGETNLPDRNGGVEVDAGAVLDSLEFGAMVRVEGHSEDWRVLGDFAYLGLGRRSDRGLAEQDFDTAMAELAGAWRPNEHVDLIFGARYWALDTTIDFDSAAQADIERDRNWVDPLVGFAVHGKLGESWVVRFRGDIGGFDVGSELTWNAELLFVWHATERFALATGYRHIALEDSWDIGNETLELDVALSGPEIGFVFKF